MALPSQFWRNEYILWFTASLPVIFKLDSAVGMLVMKLIFSIIVGTSIMLTGLPLAFGFDLLMGGKTQPVNRRPYSFGDRYIYDNTGSRWNYDSAYKHSGYRYHRGNRHAKYWQPRFEYNNKRPVNENEQFQDLIKHLSNHNFQHIRAFQHDPSCR